MTSYGASLPDSEPLIHSHTSHHLSLLSSFSSFLSSLSQTQLKASSDLSSQVGSFRRSIAASASERSGGTEQMSTLERAMGEWLEKVDLQVRESGEVARRTEEEVAKKMEEVGNRLEGVRKKHRSHYQRLLSLRDAANSTRDRSRSTYFSACDSLESARQKKSTAKEGKETEKAARAYEAAVEEMEVAKNQYLLDLDAANVAKQILYETHLPSVEDDYQVLEASAVRQLVGLLEKMVKLQKESGERVLQTVAAAEGALKTVEVERDQELWVGGLEATVLGAFEVPRDVEFEESPVWHDIDAFAISSPSVTYLQNVRLKAVQRVAESGPEIESKKREVTGLRNLRESYEKNEGLGDTVGVVENLFSTVHPLAALSFASSLHAAQIELIDATLGADAATEGRPHEFKSSHFVTPSTCAVCEGSVWGKGMSCKKCNMAVHAKCELKVPSGCASRPGAGVVRTKTKRSAAAPPIAASTSLSPTPSSSSGSSFVSVGTTTLPPPRRTMPIPGGDAEGGGAAGSGGQRASMLYAYEAQTGFDLSVNEGDSVSVLQPEDDSGWVKVRVERDGREGLVPGSYVEMLDDGAISSVPTSTIQSGAGSGGGAGRVIALYDYTPAAADELPLQEGEEAELTAVGMDAGEGWAEITKDGRTGIVPSSYIQLL